MALLLISIMEEGHFMKQQWYKSPSNLVEMFENTVKKFPDRNFLGVKNSKGDYQWVTYKEVSDLNLPTLSAEKAARAVNGRGKPCRTQDHT